MGSIDVTSTVSTNFTINNTTVTNINNKNISNVSYIRNVVPDGNSEMLFSVQETPGSPWSIFNALVIEGFATGGNQNAGHSGRTTAWQELHRQGRQRHLPGRRSQGARVRSDPASGGHFSQVPAYTLLS